MTQRRFFRSQFQGDLGMSGTIYADQDSGHLSAPCCLARLGTGKIRIGTATT